jgi:hypothetical protein
MGQNKTRHMFAGGNTSKGFFSYFNYILDLKDAKKFYILKGGPGTGKSTFMKYIGFEAIRKGYDVEYFHCSSDSHSLDGVLIPALKVTMVDGTAPHTIDPVYPGVVEEIVNLGEFWNTSALAGYKDKVFLGKKEIKFNFARAYRYLEAAAALYEDIKETNIKYTDYRKVKKLACDLVEELLSMSDTENMPGKEGSERRLFASAITPDGVVHHLDSILNTNRIYGLVGEKGMGTDIVLEKVKEEALNSGYDVECFYCALLPDKLEHLIIPELDISLTTMNKYHKTELNIQKHFCFEEFVDKTGRNIYSDAISENEKQIDALIKRAVESIVKAKKFHFEMEKYYAPAMDFDRLMTVKEKVKNSIFNA